MTVDFNDYFWGDKNNGYEVLYQNMKYGLVASKELSEYFRERSNLEEHNHKVLSKLAHKAGTGCPNGTFSPLWILIKSSAERLSELHSQMMQKVAELVKNITKYAEEVQKKHKTVKEEEAHTQDAVHAMKESSNALQKAKEVYQAKLQETEKLRKDGASTKDIEKAETKMKKTHDEYKALIEKHNPIKSEFERRMTATCKRFQEVEENHLRQMREFLTTYIEIVQNNHELTSQVHVDFKRQLLEMTVDKLLEQFVLNKYTGLEKPESIDFALVNLVSTSTNANTLDSEVPGGETHSNSIAASSNQKVSSPTLSNLSHLSQSQNKKEINIRSWFNFSQNSSASGAKEEAPERAASESVVQHGRDANSVIVDVSGSASPTQISGFLRSRRDKGKSKKNKKSKGKDGEVSSTKDEVMSDSEPKGDSNSCKIEALSTSEGNVTASSANIASLATPEVDEDGYSIKPNNSSWQETSEKQIKPKGYSSSESESEEETEKKIHVEIKPLNNGSAPISASVDELRATVENMSLSPLGMLSVSGGGDGGNDDGFLCKNENNMKRSKSVSQHLLIGNNMFKHSVDLQANTIFQHQQQASHQSPVPSNASTPTAGHPYAPLQSPTLSMSKNTNNRYADLGDIFSEVGEISISAPTSARINHNRSTPTSANSITSSIAIPRPPSRRSEAAVRGRVSPASISRADSVGSLEFRTATIMASSRGPSPLTIGLNDTIPLAVAFHEIIHAYFRGSDETRCQVKMSGDLMVSFPAGIIGILANNPNPAKLQFNLKNAHNIESILPNKQIIVVDKNSASPTGVTAVEFNMAALTALLRRQSEQNPNASYFNVDILKYQIKAKPGAASCPFQLVSYWKCEKTHTDLKIDYKYNNHAMASPSPLLNVSISVPVDGGVKNVQSKPHSAWLGESNRLVWNFTDISQHSDNGGVDTLRARCELSQGPSTPALLTTQFNCEGTLLSGLELELVGSGYRVSLVKRRFISGKYVCEGDGIKSVKSPSITKSSSSSPSSANRFS